MNKRAKTTQPNSSPSSSTRQNERNASKTRSPRGKSPSGRMFRLPCKDYLKGTCTNSFCEKWHPPECCSTSPRMDADLGKRALMRIAKLNNSLAKRSKKNGDISAVAHDNWVAYLRIWSRRSLHRFCVRAQTYGNQSGV